MPKECATRDAASPDSSAKFHRDLANGLHAMAQPLTMLRAAIEVLGMPSSAGVDRQRYLEISSAAVERTCRVFAHIQDLLTSSITDAERVGFDLWEAIAPRIENNRRLLQASGVTIAAAADRAWRPVVGDAGRTEQAVEILLQTAGDLASKGDVIELSGSIVEGFLELMLENPHRPGKRVDSTARLALALAEANIVSQRGRFEFAEDPFRVSLSLPLNRVVGWRDGAVVQLEPEHQN